MPLYWRRHLPLDGIIPATDPLLDAVKAVQYDDWRDHRALGLSHVGLRSKIEAMAGDLAHRYAQRRYEAEEASRRAEAERARIEAEKQWQAEFERLAKLEAEKQRRAEVEAVTFHGELAKKKGRPKRQLRERGPPSVVASRSTCLSSKVRWTAGFGPATVKSNGSRIMSVVPRWWSCRPASS